MNKTNVIIIGAGQLGSRHLQGLKSINQELNITVIDPNKGSLKIARTRYEEINNNTVHNVDYVNDIDELGQQADVVIISTTSKYRADSLVNLLKKIEVKNIILEKPLFCTLDEFDKVDKALQVQKPNVWVNCGRRQMEFWQKIKKEFSMKPINMHIEGSNWGLMCNAIHFIDIASYITEDLKYSLNCNYLENRLVESKRVGYKELNGLLMLNYHKGSFLSMNSINTGNNPCVITISDDEKSIVIFEDLGKAIWRIPREPYIIQEEIKISFQSQMTGVIVDSIINRNKCKLTAYEESKVLHKQLMVPIMEHLNKYTEIKERIFPFT